ncbi:MAG: DegV family protein [Lachnospiraceae bacterium]|nr:DegV family protein [Lachnospiraceae bacterium]
MAKIAVVTDSNSGITQTQAKELGISVVPMPFMINNETYFEDINLTQEQFYELLESGADISTSQPSPEAIMKLWDELLEEYDEIVHIPMSSGLSGSCQSALIFAQDYDGKVQVVNNQRISVTQRQSALDAKLLVQKGMNAREIKDFLEADKFNSSIYIMLDTLYYLKKGGRITPAAAAIGSMLRLKPVLTIQGEKLDAFAKARTSGQGKSMMINALRNDINNRFGGMTDEKGIWLQIAYTHDKEAAESFKTEVQEAFPDYEIHMDPLSLSVACHIGPGALAVAFTKKISV